MNHTTMLISSLPRGRRLLPPRLPTTHNPHAHVADSAAYRQAGSTDCVGHGLPAANRHVAHHVAHHVAATIQHAVDQAMQPVVAQIGTLRLGESRPVPPFSLACSFTISLCALLHRAHAAT